MRAGIVCGLRSERAALGPAGRSAQISGANAQRAYAAARDLAAGGADVLVSIGLAGALCPDLEPGDLLLPEAVLAADGRRWQAMTLAAMPEGPDKRPLFGSDTIVSSAGAKAGLRGTGAASVDMESHGVARAAEEAGLPFLAIRAVADPADQALPAAAQNAVRPDGSVDTLRTVLALLRRPQDFGALLALGRQASRGLAALRGPGAGILRGLTEQNDMTANKENT